MPPETPTVPVATSPNVDGVPAPVHIASLPMVGTLEVEIAAVIVGLEPPRKAPITPPKIMPPPEVTVVVPTEAKVLAPVAYTAWLAERAEVVARPAYPTELPPPKTVKLPVRGNGRVSVDVETEATVLTPVEYKTAPPEAIGLEVESPLKDPVTCPFEYEREMGNVPVKVVVAAL